MTLILGLAALRLVAVILGPMDEIVRVFASHDDAFYYFQIAWNLAHGFGSTFDRVHPTNGYQPLWGWLLAGVARFCSDRDALLRAGAATAAALFLSAGWLLARAAARLFHAPTALVALALWAFFPAVERNLMLEAPLHAACVALVIGLVADLATVRDARDSRRRAWIAGVAFALLALARLDELILVVVAGVLLAAMARRRGDALRSVRRLSRLWGPTAAVVGLYALGNRLWIGSALPISGLVKQRELDALLAAAWRDDGTAALMRLVHERITDCVHVGVDAFFASWLAFLLPSAERLYEWMPWSIVAGCSAAAIGFAGTRVLRDEPARVTWLAIGGGVTVHFACMTYLVGVDARPWQWTALQVVLCLLVPAAVLALLAAVVRDAPRAERIGHMLGLVALVAMSTAFTRFAVIPAVTRASSAEPTDRPYAGMAPRLAARLPAGTRVGAYNAGALAYFSNLQVVNLDGLVNSPSFRDDVRRMGWLGYLDANQIQYVSDVPGMYSSLPDPEMRMRIVARDEIAGTTHLLWWIQPRERADADATGRDRPIASSDALSLLADLGGADAVLRGEAARILESIAETARAEADDEALRRRLAAHSAELPPLLTAAMLAPEPRVRYVAAWWIALLRPAADTVAASIDRALADPEWKVRQAGAAAAGSLGAGGEWTVPRLVQLLDDPAPPVQERAATALGEIGTFTTPVVQALRHAAAGDDEAARAAGEALAVARPTREHD